MWYSQYKKDKKSIGAVLCRMEEQGVPLRVLESVVVNGERKEIIYGSIVYASFEFIDDEPEIYYASFTPVKSE